MYIDAYVHIDVHSHIYTYMYIYTCVYIRAYTHTCIHTIIHVFNARMSYINAPGACVCGAHERSDFSAPGFGFTLGPTNCGASRITNMCGPKFQKLLYQHSNVVSYTPTIPQSDSFGTPIPLSPPTSSASYFMDPGTRTQQQVQWIHEGPVIPQKLAGVKGVAGVLGIKGADP